MKKIKALLFVTILFISAPLVVGADCESDFKALESEFKVSYEYNKDSDDFTITLVNPDTGRYSWGFNDPNAAMDIATSDDGKKATYTIKNYKQNYYKYSVLATYSECYHKQYKLGVLNLEKTNPYASNELCEGNEDFVLCQEDYEKRIDEDEFKSRIEAYEQSKNNSRQTKKDTDDKEDEPEEKNNFFKEIIEFIQEHIILVIIAAVVILAAIAVAVVAIKKSIKSRRLE